MNIAYRIKEVSKKIPDKKSVVLAKDKSFYTFREFEERSNQFAHRFVKLGITPGMRTLLFVKPCLDFSVITFALFKVGAVPVLIDPGMGIPNLLQCVKQVRPGALISIGLVHWMRRFKKEYFKEVEVKISLHRVGGSTHYLFDEIEKESRDFTPYDVSQTDYGAILFTSGGTGIPKGVLYTHGILNAQTDLLKEMFSLDESKVDLPGFPLFALFTLAMGMTSVIPEMNPAKPSHCDPKKIVKNILDHQVTFVAGSPAIWERVGNYCLKNKIKLPSVVHVVMFGAPVRATLHEIYREVLVHGDTYTPYGATEGLPVSLVSGSEVLKEHVPKMLKGFGTCIGKPVKGTKIKIMKVSDIPQSSILELSPGEFGEIVVQGPQVTPGYFEMDEETKKAKIFEDGELWHRMGDLGWVDEKGNLWFLGRKAHRVVSQEKIFYPLQLEAIFNQHPKVKRSALIKIKISDKIYPSLVIERHDKKTHMTKEFLKELTSLKESHPLTKEIHNFFLHSGFPVDVRHNIKIDRIKLSLWAQERLEKA
jgi:acyl-CoA synthetase (AMP-forming)/AMP-acid ligase II